MHRWRAFSLSQVFQDASPVLRNKAI
ncbi:hypothetical protein SKA58_03260 [Sphingomonas sp. SKA58]|nr:hypothetical protein SKA58_03260 [Sphingomonas sp. SKA58]